ncbi:hypothetical protein C4D60_Mb05t11420 [Musa balbisiana]|uniref:cysteine dioxygenase n=1 Tax=Musa balbisiana TaxID=52838 RepID=A0A4S8JVC1_MUSBA|nr:hypothetical protein C4D60_Mb05t11420 [Musa balbisiana]
MPSVVQRLFETCKAVFAEGGDGIIPSLEDVNRLRSFLDQHPGLRLAKVKTDAIFTAPCKASVLYPEDGGDGKLAPDEDEVYAWLEERKKPDDFLVVGAKYSGPRIMER